MVLYRIALWDWVGVVSNCTMGLGRCCIELQYGTGSVLCRNALWDCFDKWCLKNEESVLSRVCKPVNTRLRVFFSGFKISGIDQLILALIFRFGFILG